MVFDLTDRKSFEDLNQWLNDVHSLCDPNAVVTLIGNKSDLTGSRSITTSEAESFAQMHQLSYLETSALGGDHIQEAFQRTASAVYRKSLSNKDPKKTDNIKKIDDKKSNDGCGC